MVSSRAWTCFFFKFKANFDLKALFPNHSSEFGKGLFTMKCIHGKFDLARVSKESVLSVFELARSILWWQGHSITLFLSMCVYSNSQFMNELLRLHSAHRDYSYVQFTNSHYCTCLVNWHTDLLHFCANFNFENTNFLFFSCLVVVVEHEVDYPIQPS